MEIEERLPLTDEYLKKMDAYWRAANYLGAAQLYLLDNPLLREPLKQLCIRDSRIPFKSRLQAD